MTLMHCHMTLMHYHMTLTHCHMTLTHSHMTFKLKVATSQITGWPKGRNYTQSVGSDVEEGTCVRCACTSSLSSFGSDSQLLVTVRSVTVLSLLELSATPYSPSLMPFLAWPPDCALNYSIEQIARDDNQLK